MGQSLSNREHRQTFTLLPAHFSRLVNQLPKQKSKVMKSLLMFVAIFAIASATSEIIQAEKSENNSDDARLFGQLPRPVTNAFNIVMTIKGIIIVVGALIVTIWAFAEGDPYERVIEDPCLDCPPYRPPTPKPTENPKNQFRYRRFATYGNSKN